MCNSLSCNFAGIVVSILVGIAAGLLFAFGLLPSVLVAVWVSLVLAFVLLAYILALTARGAGRGTGTCQCRNVLPLLLAVLGTIALAIIALSVTLAATSALSAVLIGLGAAFVAGMLTQLFCLIRCLVNRSCDTCEAKE